MQESWSYKTSSGEVEACKEEIKMASLTEKPFGVNLPILFLQDDSIVDFVAECGVKFATTSAGNPAKYIDRLKSAGLIVYHAVPSMIGAEAQEAGVDGLSKGLRVEDSKIQGNRSTRFNTSWKKLIYLIAAGGIADGIGAAAFACGAEIQMGTRFVSSKKVQYIRIGRMQFYLVLN